MRCHYQKLMTHEYIYSFARKFGAFLSFENHTAMNIMNWPTSPTSSLHSKQQAEIAVELKRKVVLSMEINPRSTNPAHAPRHAPQSVLLTGATGMLGAYLLHSLLDTCEAEILCLVRAAHYEDGMLRLIDSLRFFDLWPKDEARAQAYRARLVPLCGDLSQAQLGLSDEDFAALSESADAIFHSGSRFDAIASYESMATTNVFGTREVLRLACLGHVKPVHFVSTLSLYSNEAYFNSAVSEDSAAPSDQYQHNGYLQSKWVAEQLCLVARERGLPVAIYRAAQITGDSRTGMASMKNFFHAWLTGCVQLGMLPDIANDALDMVPVDYIARAIVAFALGAADANGNFHFSNSVRLSFTTASEIFATRGIHLRTVPYVEWRTSLQNAVAQGIENALASYAEHYPETADASAPSFDCKTTEQAAAAVGLHCPPGDATLLSRYIDELLTRR